MNEQKVNEILHNWLEKNGEWVIDKYGSIEKVEEIVVNCVSLSQAWFSTQNEKEFSFEISLYDKDGAIVETLHGVTADNLPSMMFDIIVSKSDNYSKLSLMKYKYVSGNKQTDLVGELEIS